MKRIVLLTPDEDDALGACIRAAVGDTGQVVRPAARTVREVHRLLPDADIVVGDWLGDLPLGAAEAAIPRHCTLIQQPGVGVNFIDVAAWAAAGVPVANVPGANAASVAEWAVVAAASLSRSMPWAHDEMRAGRWPQETIPTRGCRDLGELRVGIVGFGAIGRRCATLFAAFGCEVVYTARTARPDATARFLPMAELLAVADVLVVAVPLTDDTRGLISARELATLPPRALVVNVARGLVVDEPALVAALRSGAMAGAALDVFAAEPLAPDSPLRTLDCVLLSPHIAGGSETARRKIYAMTAENVARVCAGERPRWTL
ncbi:D-3-phosphoglycerate dehydrogenase [Nocardia transvalensis]|uniref:D-3-phosphoglycerate dehydrogenase n=1 Tax=Nocardia transvalensis TaxID=37333 RepID=A0A7W9PI58_9NOCA|nr:NAD(P)-dependent oxidoreductase [Nocardia transvalensis]MBB5916138.1 D-3-phosphoglycerate dehydrogenase [Nocardia transvalensis]